MGDLLTNPLLTPFIVFAFYFLFVMFKAWQQLNVMNKNWWMIPIPSFGMGFLDASMVGIVALDVVSNGIWRIFILGLAYWFGGCLGTWTGMYIHKRIHG